MKRLEEKVWWAELLENKDELSLRELSERFGASPAAIANALKRNGIKRRSAPAGPRAKRRSAGSAKRPGRRSVLDKFQQQMGSVVDREIAERAGVTVSAVTNYRKRHNIKASTTRGRPRKKGGRSGGLAAPRAAGPRGYRVVIGRESFVVIAVDITEAAAKAKRADRGEVTHIELLGRALG